MLLLTMCSSLFQMPETSQCTGHNVKTIEGCSVKPAQRCSSDRLAIVLDSPTMLDNRTM